MLPLGPSSSDVDKRGERRASLALATHNDMGLDMDVDNLPSSRFPPSSKNNDVAIRAGSGMYADREGSDLPIGPRAMTSKVSVSTSSSMISVASSPTTPFIHQGGAGGRTRERSPPPHMAGNHDG